MRITYYTMYDLYDTGNYVRSFASRKSLDEYLSELPLRKTGRTWTVIQSEHVAFN